MKKLFLLLFIAVVSLNAAGFWTLTGVTKANVYVKNDVSLLKPDTIKTIKEKMYTALKNLGIQTKVQDSPTLMVVMEDLDDDGTHYVYVKLALGEEVQTYRADKSSTFSLTYADNDFIDVDLDELDSGVLESVDFLLSQFSEHFNDDKD
ncbi:hypothetical protein JHD46_08065 [Sulfurimonas sp. SAG-AH-194-C20]|nr:hypothetical protein [Sulfurimonas sp. SAG-AH-194-C20]MDF1879589.1 hypothetical protein [Sulfurimonas sp. SAG-AH-194-C20]